ncbi:MAG TPA: hypothetical protein DCM25_08735 [Rhodobacteraceae bacterium]|nr:hypothetical protein [Paracoccaceae bacterium]
MKDRVVICDTCTAKGAAPGGTAWADHLSIAVVGSGLDVDVTTTSCLNMCDSPVSFALQGPGKATYLFTGADPETDTQDMLELLKLYLDAPDGWVSEAQTAGRLRLCLRGRVPKL